MRRLNGCTTWGRDTSSCMASCTHPASAINCWRGCSPGPNWCLVASTAIGLALRSSSNCDGEAGDDHGALRGLIQPPGWPDLCTSSGATHLTRPKAQLTRGEYLSDSVQAGVLHRKGRV